MNKILYRKWSDIWTEIFSPTIFMLDLIEGFKYRKKQTWLTFIVALGIFALVGWLFSIDVATLDWSSSQMSFLFLFYSLLLVTVLFWFRACSIYDLSVLQITKHEGFITKKQIRASLLFKITMGSFGLYFCYWMYQLLVH
jgi:hypothetical protein